MKLYPAIDIKNGKCVRLQQGKFDLQTIYSNDPCEIALKWKEKGADFLHIVDLDGALAGKSINMEVISKIVTKTGLKVQLGGGIRTIKDIEEKIAIGIERVILGTIAVKNKSLVEEAIKKFGSKKVVIGIDAKDGYVAIEGWENVSRISVQNLCNDMKKIGVETIIYTDIARDGMLSSPNFESTKDLVTSTNLEIIASGGVSSISDLVKLKSLGVHGAIIGKALYTNNIDLEEALKIV